MSLRQRGVFKFSEDADDKGTVLDEQGILNVLWLVIITQNRAALLELQNRRNSSTS